MNPLKLLSLLLLVGMGVKGQTLKGLPYNPYNIDTTGKVHPSNWMIIDTTDYKAMKDSIIHLIEVIRKDNNEWEKLLEKMYTVKFQNDSLRKALTPPGFCRLVIECDTVPSPKYKKINGRWVRIN